MATTLTQGDMPELYEQAKGANSVK